MRVAVLPTGGMELRGLPSALTALFPGHEFYFVPKRAGDEAPFDSFTSSGKPLVRGAPNGNVTKIVQAMAAELAPGRDRNPADLLIVLEDLEVPNKPQPGGVVDVFRDATRAHLQDIRRRSAKLAAKLEPALLEKASFHLAAPMIEAWLFADPNGARNASVPRNRLPPPWSPGQDAEDFLTAHPDYLTDDCSACTGWRELPPIKLKDHQPAWLTAQRGVHPKAFLSWLCRDATEKKCSRYRETHEGAEALKVLDWRAALAAPAHCMFLRALVADLADGLEQQPAFSLDGAVSPLTSRAARRAAPVLRNI